MSHYGYGYGSAPQPYHTSIYGAPPPVYGAPYGAPSAPYGGPPASYVAPAPPYGAPPTPYGASPYGTQAQSPYGAPPAANGAAPSAPPAAASSSYANAAAAAPAAGDQPHIEAKPISTASQQQQQQSPSSQSPMATLGAGFPWLPAPASVVVNAGSSSSSNNNTGQAGNSSSSRQQRPSSAYPAIGFGSSPASSAGPTPSTDPLTRPMSAIQPPATYTVPYGTAPYDPTRQTAPFTYGQPAPASRPPAYLPPTTYAPAPGHGARRRRGVLIGCSYPGSSAALNGCLNDVQCIQFCLQKRFGFTEQQLVVLRDDPGRHPDFISTRVNILRAIQWLMMDQRYGDSLFFHFSGHGNQKYDYNGDEEDGYDETICPSDFKRAGEIVDDELNRLMVRSLMPGVTLHAVIDACHSGTVLDLAFRAKVDSAGRCYWKGRPRYDKGTAGGTAFQFGACTDSQKAQDTKALSGYAYTGAATFCFIQAIEKYGINQTYGQILSHMTSSLRAATGPAGISLRGAGSFVADILLESAAFFTADLLQGSAKSLLTSGGQTPVLSCDKQVDLHATKLSL